MNMEPKYKIMIVIALVSILIGFLGGAMYERHVIEKGIIEFGKSITGNIITIDINETIFADELLKRIQPKLNP